MKTEPNAELRAAASTLWQMFTALVDEGFTEHQALIVLGQVMASSMGGGSSNND